MAGVYADEGTSGTVKKKRDGFLRLLQDCEAGKIDMLLTKSISRFARNTVDLLTTIRSLKSKNIAVYFEKENINTLESTGEILITILSSQAQEESRNISENIRWSLRSKYEKGEPTITTTTLWDIQKVRTENCSLFRRKRRLFKKFSDCT